MDPGGKGQGRVGEWLCVQLDVGRESDSDCSSMMPAVFQWRKMRRQRAPSRVVASKNK